MKEITLPTRDLDEICDQCKHFGKTYYQKPCNDCISYVKATKFEEKTTK